MTSRVPLLMPELHTERLLLRPPIESDFEI